MPLVTELDLPDYPYGDPELRGARFDETVAGLAARSWLAQMPLGYVVLHRAPAEHLLRSRSLTFPGQKVAEIAGIDSGPLHEEIERNILHVNGADHRRLRNLVNPSFTPRAVERWRPAMRRFIGELFAEIEPHGLCDFVATVAKPYPSQTIATVMGAPLEDAPRLWEWSNVIQRQFSASLFEERETIERAVEEFYVYAGHLLAERRAEPRDDLLSELSAAEQEGDRLSDVECVNLVLNVLIGGVDTTQSQLAQAIRLFAEHPDQWELLGERPELAPHAVEEVVRFAPITPFTARIALEDVTVGGVTFPEGTVLLICAHTANRDAEAYVEPDAFDITAAREARPLTFGAGPHHCLGANLARAELQEALAFLARRMPALELNGEPVFGSVDGIYGLEELPIRFAAG